MPGPGVRSGLALAALAVAAQAAALLAPGPAAPDDAIPAITSVAAPRRIRVGAAADVRVSFRAPRGDVVAVIQEIDELDDAGAPRATRMREFGMVAQAFGREAGELVLPVSFTLSGRKRLTFTLVTDQRETSDPASVEVDAVP